MNMVTYYNRGDLSSFGNYLLSEERKQSIINNTESNNLNEVHHSDVENWKEIEEDKKRKG